ncbi:sialin-like [Zophobas morio]|uniref:sialin-like n=1 Tax=Zophobas morio TaxID=2755281 RepID=UPI00308354BF
MATSSSETLPLLKISQTIEGNYPTWMFWKKKRNVVAILAFFGFLNCYTIKVNLSVAIVAMTTNTTIVMDNVKINEVSEFNWDSKMRGYVLSAFFYGYMTTQMIGGWLSIKIGGQKLFGLGIVMAGFLTLLTPWASRTSVYLLIVLRILEGICEGVTSPCMNTLWSKWAPSLERTKLATVAMSGCYFGTVLAMTASAYLAETLGWPSIFYVFGGISIVWFIIWMWFVSETPAEDPRISKTELNYILQSVGSVQDEHMLEKSWTKMLTSPAVWAIIVYSFANDWAFYTILTQLPTYLKDRFAYDLGKIGFLSCVPYIATPFVIIISGQLADWLRKTDIFTTTQVRKIFTCTSSVAQTLLLIAVSHCSSVTVTVFCIVLGAAFEAWGYSGYGVNGLDIAPQHAGLISGISNTVACLAGMCSPIFAGYIVTTSLEEWRIVFYLASGIIFFGGVFYGVFASGDVQAWNVSRTSSYELLMTISDDDDDDE